MQKLIKLIKPINIYEIAQRHTDKILSVKGFLYRKGMNKVSRRGKLTNLRKCINERIRHTFVILGSEETSLEKLYSWVCIIYQASDMGQVDSSSDLSRRQETMGRRLEKNKLHCWHETRKWSLIWLLLPQVFAVIIARSGVRAGRRDGNIFPSQTKMAACLDWRWLDTECLGKMP